MIDPAKKQLVFDSLKILDKRRIQIMFRLKAVSDQKIKLIDEEQKLLAELIQVKKKMRWELINREENSESEI